MKQEILILAGSIDVPGAEFNRILNGEQRAIFAPLRSVGIRRRLIEFLLLRSES